MDLKKMEYFIAAAEEGTFTKAANRCYISQTAISQQIAGLEKELEVTLFDRTGYRPRLTPAGSHFYDCCKKLTAEFDQVVEDVRSLADENKRELNVGISGTCERLMLIPVLREYVEMYPDITINLVEHSVSECVRLLKEGVLDVLFILSDDLKNEQNIEMAQLFLKRLSVIVPPDHKLATREEVKGHELKDEQFVVFAPEISSSLFQSFINGCRKDGYEPQISQMVTSPFDIPVMVGIGKGIAIISEDIRLDESLVHSVRLIESAHRTEYCLASLKNNTAYEVADFMDCARKTCAKV